MFGNKTAPQSASQAPQTSAVKTDDMILHVMPREFLGRPAQPLSAPVPVSVPAVVPAVAPIPTPVPPPVAQAPIIAPGPKPPVVQPPAPRRKFGVVIFLFLLLLLIAGGGVGAYYYYFLMPVPVVITAPPPEPTPVPVPEPVPVATVPVPGKDTDSDGLTDVEELLYGTDYRNPDTDGDTFLDGNEVFHRYHPNGSAPQTLLDTGAVRIFQSPEAPFTIYYPSTWTPVVDATTGFVTFRSPSTASIVIATIAKDPTENLEVWYQQTVPSENSQPLEPSYTSQGLLALSKRDERIAYIDGGSKVFTLTYSLGEETTIEYLTTFQMMLNSLTLLP
ncbi:MAG: hypothetical protein WC802_04930 [Patescibacteria group bacterium]|jgi:hypothetical protein